MDRNVYGAELHPCSEDPLTGFLRDGCCRDRPDDPGRHEICAIVTDEFLAFSKRRGNDLTTSQPDFAFPGLEPGDRWCLCVDRWIEAHDADVAPPIVLEATSEAVLTDIPTDVLREYDHGRAEDSDGVREFEWDSDTTRTNGTDPDSA